MKNFNKNLIIVFLTLFFVLGFVLPISALAVSPSAVNLGSAGNFTILAKTGISTTGTTSVIGDIGISPAEATYITGFGLILPASSVFSTSSLVTGKIYAPSYANPTPSNLITAVLDMQTAYTDAAGRASGFTELGAGNIGGLTLSPGVYKWGTGVTIPTDVTLSGGANDVWIFQIAQNLNVSSATKVILSGGAQASNVFWVVAGQTTIGTTAVFNGNILDQTAIVLNTGAILNGRALAQTAVTLDSNMVAGGNSVISTPQTITPVPLVSGLGLNSGPIACTMDAKQCSDGTYVGRSGPNCEFICPNHVSSVPTTNFGCSGGNKFNTSTGKICVNTLIKSYDFGSMTLKNGSKGEAVKELQRFLNAKLNLGLKLDGKLGPKTIIVIKKWQKDNGLVSDGLIGAKTKAKMNAQVE